MKDLNMKNSDRQLSLDLDIVGELATVLQADSSLLARLGIMDYSLLIGIHEKHSGKPGRRMSGVTAPISLTNCNTQRVDANTFRPNIFKSYCGGIASSKGTNEIYFLGIIDILQFYNYKKHGETIIKGLSQDRRELSSVNPYFYASRFLRFILKFTDYDEYEKNDKSRYKINETWI
jgi:1-phosphatidylinositol-4-phosphate 5-kinase